MRKDVIKFIEKEKFIDKLYRICSGNYVGKCHGRKRILVKTWIYYSDEINDGFKKIVTKGAYYPSLEYSICPECGKVSFLGGQTLYNNYAIMEAKEIRKAWLELSEDIKKRFIEGTK